MTFKQQLREDRARWQTLFLYERFQQMIITVITVLIAIISAVATWQLVLTVGALLRSNLLVPSNFEVFQAIFGMIFTVLIALEFKHSLHVTFHGQQTVVQVQAVVLIALLALVRKFIVLDIHTTPPSMIAAIAFAALALGIVYWLIRRQAIGEKREGQRDEPRR